MSNGVYIGSEALAAANVPAMYVGVDNIARKVTKGYIGDSNGVARLFYTALVPFTYSYTGTFTESEITIDGVVYTVLAITSSGTLSVTRTIDADVWLCGGGGNGGNSTSGNSNGNTGGGGGGGHVTAAQLQLSGSVACAIGAAQGATSIGTIRADGGETPSGQYGGKGASGGGGGLRLSYGAWWSTVGGTGLGESTIPADFGQDSPHCAGGGAGSSQSYGIYAGGAGGSNGSNGEASSTEKLDTYPPTVLGGEKGGGNGNADATFYGGGGGGANLPYVGPQTGCSGYQGVIYIRWKKEDAA